MAIDKGNIKTSANYDVRAQKPMEARREKPRKVDLITKESWSYDGNTVYAHVGLQVWVVEEGKTYVLKDLSKMFEPDYSGWDEMLTASTGGGGGLELRELKMSGSADDNAYNLETLELMRENKVLPAINAGDGTLVPLTYGGDGQFILQVVQMGIEMQMSLTMEGDGSITMTEEFLAPPVLAGPEAVKKWINKNNLLAQLSLHEPAYVIHSGQFCLIDYVRATTPDNSEEAVQYNYGNKRFERTYDVNTGKEIITIEIPIGSGGGGSTADLYPSEYNDEFNDDFTI